jgi:predicted ATPase
LLATKGFAAPEAGQTYGRALELCRQLGETPQLFPVLVGLRMFYAQRGELKTARELGEQLLRLAESTQGSDFLVEAHYALGVPLYWQGELPLALTHFEQGARLYDPQLHRSHAFRYGLDPGVSCLLYSAWTHGLLGYADQSLTKGNEALSLARNISHPFSLGYAMIAVVMVHVQRQESLVAREQAEHTIAFCREQGFSFFLAAGQIARGWALAHEGQKEEGVTQLRQGLALWQAMGQELIRPYYLSFLAEAYESIGEVEQGLACVAEAFSLIEKSDERLAEAELYRLKGTLTLQSQTSLKQVQDKSQTSQEQSENPKSPILNPQSNAEVKAEGYFLKAIAIAQKQQAKSSELRATVSLARLWQRQGKQHEAHLTLSEIYNWFTEGFDTKDLQEAKALLEELSH